MAKRTIRVGPLLIKLSSRAPRLRVSKLRRSYAGIADGVYGQTTEERLQYIATERASWESRDSREI